MLCTVLVLLMQAGFTCLETGLVRAKNSINVAIKNVADVCVSGLTFWAFGFAMMFGASWQGFVGGSGFFWSAGDVLAFGSVGSMAFFFFQLAFCSTATTIVSGAVAERMKFGAYVVIAIGLSGVVYPLFGHWAWGGVATGSPAGWLEQMGFIDFAGSTVVHSIGGWIALAAILAIGPRLGRFGAKGARIEAHNMPMAALGLFLLWIGWFGFNGGSTLALNDQVPPILVHTLLAAIAGGTTVMAISWVGERGPKVGESMNGILAGLVAITASAHIVDTGEAVLIGSIGGLVCYGASLLLDRLEIDDAVDAVPVHLAAGIWGTLAVAMFGDPAAFGVNADRSDQFVARLAGVAAAGGLAFGFAYPALKIIGLLMTLRVSPHEERVGLNVSEHGASSALLDLLTRMEDQSRRGDFSTYVEVEPFTEAGEIAARYNQVLTKFNKEVAMRERTADELRDARDAALLANSSKSQFLANMSHELRTPLNAIIGFSEIITRELYGPVGQPQYEEYIADIHRSSTHLLSLINDILDLSKIEANKHELAEEEIELGEIFESCRAILEQRASAARVSLQIDSVRSVPPILADKRALRQMLLNLASNAIKFTPEGGQVHLAGCVEEDGRLAIRVTDTGVGMAREDIPKALEPFRQLSTDQTVYAAEGTGLGLPLTLALVRLHGGTLVIESEPKVGTVVTVRLPEHRILPVGGDAAMAI